MKLGYSTWGMPTVPIDQALQHIAQCGYDGVEIAVIPRFTTAIDGLDQAERKRIMDLIRQHGLTLTAIAGHVSLLEPDPTAHARNVERLKATIDLAIDWAQDGEPPCVETLSGGHSEDWPAQHQILAERFVDVARYAESRGVVLAVEPHVHHLVDTPDRMIRLIELVDSPNLRVNFDISHFDVLGMSIEESVKALLPYSVHTHVKDQRGKVPDFEFLIPGEGDFDYVSYLQIMAHYGYEGFINAEVSMMVQKRPDYDPLAAATFSYETLSRAFAEAGIQR